MTQKIFLIKDRGFSLHVSNEFSVISSELSEHGFFPSLGFISIVKTSDLLSLYTVQSSMVGTVFGSLKSSSGNFSLLPLSLLHEVYALSETEARSSIKSSVGDKA